jgi:ppGpp synthetase/RelA/SpoT-type nucleotidyltranferase
VSELSAARELWLSERPKYERLLGCVRIILDQRIRSQGIFVRVSGRTKETPNLLKKLLKKGYGYERITDKAGARVAVRFRHEVEPVLATVERSFEILSREDKAESLGHNKVGYSGVHYDVRLQPASMSPEDADLRDLQCEIQVHTLCQSLWAEMDHELSYKPAQPVPADLRRQIYLLNALLEIGDRSFNSINREIATLPGAYAMGLFQNLEGHYYRFTGQRFDPELSQQALENILTSYDASEIPRLSAIIDEFIESHTAKLRFVFNEYESVDDRPLMLFQPECFLLLERLEKNPHVLEEVWTRRYPRDELERLAVAWSMPLD